jgi:hypothetical protein
MGVYAYCVVPFGHPIPTGLTGLGSAEVNAFPSGDIAIWITRGERPDPGIQGIQAHNAVVEAAVTEQVTPVPLRFGQWLAEESELQAAVAEKATSYRERLAQFAGCLEFGIRLIDPADLDTARVVHRTPATSGLEYMRALQESSRLAETKRAESEAVHAQIRELLREWVREEKVEEARTPHAVLTVSHLVARSNFDKYRAQGRNIRALFPELRMLLSGPWPPYSFAV